jgi:hypothetical protein
MGSMPREGRQQPRSGVLGAKEGWGLPAPAAGLPGDAESPRWVRYGGVVAGPAGPHAGLTYTILSRLPLHPFGLLETLQGPPERGIAPAGFAYRFVLF